MCTNFERTATDTLRMQTVVAGFAAQVIEWIMDGDSLDDCYNNTHLSIPIPVADVMTPCVLTNALRMLPRVKVGGTFEPTEMEVLDWEIDGVSVSDYLAEEEEGP